MKNENEFDELARRKLEERSFPFQEAHWVLAKQALVSLRRRRRRRRFIMIRLLRGSALLLLMGWGFWSVVQDGGVDEAIPIVVVQGDEQLKKENKHTDPKEAQFEQPEQGVGGESDESVGTSEAINHTRPSAPLADVHLPASNGPKGRPIESGPVLISNNDGTAVAPPSGSITVRDPIEPTDQITTANIPDQPPIAVRTVDGADTDAAIEAGPFTGKSIEAPVEKDDQDAMVPAVLGTSVAIAADMNSVQVSEPERDDENLSGEVGSEADQQDAERPIATTNEVTTLSGSPNDSLAPTPNVLAPPVVPDAAPWEVGVIGGVLSSTTRYSGGNSEAWGNTLDRVWTPGGGVELMHMGRNVGLGLGIFYGTYAEEFRTGSLNNTTFDHHRSWYLTQVDTIVFYITDSIVQGGGMVYVGQSILTSINVLSSTLDTIVTTTQQRDASMVENRVSYLEVPLLIDGRIVQGSWCIGVRGGPSLGLLTSRRGTVPNGSNDGYIAFSDQQFRDLTVGYMLRGYIRYRFNAAWSVGFEPMLRGQLMNSLDGGELSRISTASGVMIGLTYKLR